MAEEIRRVTWDLEGEELRPWQAAQRLYRAGFVDAKELATMWAVLEAESGGYLKAWHHNVARNPDKTIARSSDGTMSVLSTDLGFIQRNVRHNPPVKLSINEASSRTFVATLFEKYPELADGQKSAAIARELFVERGYQPWYAYSNASYEKSLPRACEAVGNFLAKVLVNDSHLLIRRNA